MRTKIPPKAWAGAAAGFVVMALLWHYDLGLTRHGRPIGGNPWGESLLFGCFVAAFVLATTFLRRRRQEQGTR